MTQPTSNKSDPHQGRISGNENNREIHFLSCSGCISGRHILANLSWYSPAKMGSMINEETQIQQFSADSSSRSDPCLQLIHVKNAGRSLGSSYFVSSSITGLKSRMSFGGKTRCLDTWRWLNYSSIHWVTFSCFAKIEIQWRIESHMLPNNQQQNHSDPWHCYMGSRLNSENPGWR